MGREDFQVKVQGFRVELGDIEAALESHPHLRNAVVVAVGPDRGNKRLVGYVVPEQEPHPEAAALDLDRESRERQDETDHHDGEDAVPPADRIAAGVPDAEQERPGEHSEDHVCLAVAVAHGPIVVPP